MRVQGLAHDGPCRLGVVFVSHEKVSCSKCPVQYCLCSMLDLPAAPVASAALPGVFGGVGHALHHTIIPYVLRRACCHSHAVLQLAYPCPNAARSKN
jgi:hypothetical protein